LRKEISVMPIDLETLKLATDISKAAMGQTNWIGNPKAVAEFIDVVAQKLDHLRHDPDQ
jgi:hypothetical protein